MDRNGVYGLMGHVQRNRHVENLLGDAEYAQAADAVSSSEADQLRKRKFEDDRGKAHVLLVRHLVQANLKAQEMDARLLKVPKATDDFFLDEFPSTASFFPPFCCWEPYFRH